MEPQLETDVLSRLIDEKAEVLEKLRELALRQLKLVAGGETTMLMRVLAVKQRLLDQLQSLERQLDPFRSQDPDSRNWRSGDHRERCRAAAQRCEALLAEIMLVERQCETSLRAQRDEASVRLQGAHQAHQARDAYASAAGRRAARLDITSDS